MTQYSKQPKKNPKPRQPTKTKLLLKYQTFLTIPNILHTDLYTNDKNREPLQNTPTHNGRVRDESRYRRNCTYAYEHYKHVPATEKKI